MQNNAAMKCSERRPHRPHGPRARTEPSWTRRWSAVHSRHHEPHSSVASCMGLVPSREVWALVPTLYARPRFVSPRAGTPSTLTRRVVRHFWTRVFAPLLPSPTQKRGRRARACFAGCSPAGRVREGNVGAGLPGLAASGRWSRDEMVRPCSRCCLAPLPDVLSRWGMPHTSLFFVRTGEARSTHTRRGRASPVPCG